MISRLYSLKQELINDRLIFAGKIYDNAGNELIGTFNDEPQNESKKYRHSFIATDAEILVVDDNEMNLLVTSDLLKPPQIRVNTALRSNFPRQMMSSFDGVQTLKMAKASRSI